MTVVQESEEIGPGLKSIRVPHDDVVSSAHSCIYKNAHTLAEDIEYFDACVTRFREIVLD